MWTINLNLLSVIFIGLIRATYQASECNQDILDRSFVTQCGTNFCEPLIELDEKTNKKPDEWPSSREEIIQIVSTRKGDRLKISKHKSIYTNSHYYEESHINGTIFVDTQTQYQKVLGFGSTLTDASCVNVDDLSDDLRSKLINDYFNPDEGIGLNLIKIPIGSTKYSYTNYVLDEPDSSQVELSPYDINNRIGIIKDALKSAGKFKNRIKILASSTSAPPEYKDNNRMIYGGYLRQDKFDDYARYLTSFIASYKPHDLNIWSLIISELPASISQDVLQSVNETLNYNSMAMRPSDAAKLIRAINMIRAQRNDVDRFRLMLLGDNRAFIPVWTNAIMQSKDLAESVAGVAYINGINKFAPYDNLFYATKRYPNKYLLAIQSSINAPMKLGNWQYAENYGTEIVKNFEYGAVGWIDFNLALNLEGGPCIDEKFRADASVVVDAKKGTYYRNPMFYAIGHLSKYVRPGSVRVKSVHHWGAHMFANQYIAFQTPDNYLVVFVMNNNIGPMPVSIGIDTITRVQVLLETKSFNTFIFRL